jgi:molybdenum cofactor cytidylyltransferase
MEADNASINIFVRISGAVLRNVSRYNICMISAVILAAGQSRRMGQPKMLLPWGNTTVLGKVIEMIRYAGIDDVLIVTGGAKAEVEKSIRHYAVRIAHNDNKGEMLESIQIGLRTQKNSEAVLIALGDQPQIEGETARKIIEAWNRTCTGIVVPSYENKRGHPWLIAKKYWDEILNMPTDKSMRDFFSQHKDEILYVNVDTPTILQDLDTPEDYMKFKP